MSRKNKFDDRYLEVEGTEKDIVIGTGDMQINLSEIEKRVSSVLADNSVQTKHMTDGAITPIKTTGLVPTSEKGVAGGVATLGDDEKIPTNQINTINIELLIWTGV